MKNTLKWTFLGTLLLLMLLFSGCGSKETPTPQQHVNSTSPAQNNESALLFLGEQDYAPISFEENGQVVGISPDIIREVFKRMGYEVKLQLLPWKRVQEMVKDGEADGFFSPYKSVERQTLYTFPLEPLLIEKNVFVVHKDSSITYDGDISKLKSYGIGTLMGYTILDKHLENHLITNVDISPNVEASLNKLLSGERKVDLVVNTNYILQYTAKKMNITDSLKELSPPLAEVPSYLAFTKKKDQTALIANFEMELKKMKQDGSYQKILEKYLGAQD